MTIDTAGASGSLWRHPDFMKLWAAQTVSSFGARIAREGLPMAAVITLAANPWQMGVLAAMARGPAVLVGLFGGGWIDRSARRPILIAADLGRALVLGCVPLAALLHLLGVAHIYIAAALVGALSGIFDIADHAYLPSLIRRDQLIDGNAKLAATESLAEVGGPAVNGVLIGVFHTFAIAFNAASYLVSAAFLATIRQPEPPPAPPGPPGHPLTDFNQGLRIALAHPLIRPLLLLSIAGALIGSFYSALYTLFGLTVLRLTPAMMGVTVSMGGVGALLGVAIAAPVIRRLGIGPALLITWLVTSVSSLLIPLATGSPLLAMGFLVLGQLLGDSLGTVQEIAARSLRQSALPLDVMGRVGGVFAAAGGVFGVVGALTGGWLGLVLGPRETLLIASVGLILTPLIGFFSPLRRQRETPQIVT